MAVTSGQSADQSGSWRVLLRPRWIVWHAFVVLSTVGMLALGDWQLHRAQSGNELSWAYTFEWPLFAGFTVYFWIKSLRDELRLDAAGGRPGAAAAGSSGIRAGTGGAETADAAEALGAAVYGADGPDTASTPRPGRDGGRVVLTPADGEAYVAWLRAEVQHRGRWQRWR